jgi:hypothetical protein
MDASGIAAAVGGSVVGVAGILTAWDASRKERASRLADAAAERAHARELAHGGRVWAERRSAYQALVAFLLDIMSTVESTHPLITFRAAAQPDAAGAADWVPEARQAPDTEEEAQLRDLEAAVLTLGSADLVALVDGFMKARRSFSFQAWSFEQVRAQAGQGEATREAREAMEAKRAELRDLFQRICARARTELTEA